MLPYGYGHSDAQGWASECPDVKNFKWRLNSIWHRMYSCIHMATVDGKWLKSTVRTLCYLQRQMMEWCDDRASQWLEQSATDAEDDRIPERPHRSLTDYRFRRPTFSTSKSSRLSSSDTQCFQLLAKAQSLTAVQWFCM